MCVCVCQEHHTQCKKKLFWKHGCILLTVNLSPLLISAENKVGNNICISRTLRLIYTEQLHGCSLHLRTQQMSAGFKSKYYWHTHKDLRADLELSWLYSDSYGVFTIHRIYRITVCPAGEVR